MGAGAGWACAHPEFPSLEIFWVRTAHPEFWVKTVLYYDILAILVLHLVIWVGNDALLPNQNTKVRVGPWANSKVGRAKQQKICRCRADSFLAHHFQKTCRRP